MKASHGQIIDKILHKRGTQVVKFWRENGYAVPIEDILKVDGVKLYTKYDGNLYASKDTFDKFSIPHLFNDRGKLEHQLVLPVERWETFNSKGEIK